MALELEGIPPVSKLLNNYDAWVTALCKKLAMWWPWVRQIFAIGYATFMDKLLIGKIAVKVAIRKSVNTNAISVVEKFEKIVISQVCIHRHF